MKERTSKLQKFILTVLHGLEEEYGKDEAFITTKDIYEEHYGLKAYAVDAKYRAAVYKSLKRLIERGLLKREERFSPEKGTAIVYIITDKGRASWKEQR